MKRILLGIIGILGLFIASPLSTASAADMPLKAPPPPPAPVYSWTGFYIGASVGGEWLRDTANLTLPPGAPQGFVPFLADGSIPSNYAVNRSNVLVAGQAGYNWQVQNWLLGLEADISGPRLSGTQNVYTSVPNPSFASFSLTYQTTVDWVGTVRARAGVLVTPTLLAYATGGLAYAQISHLYSESFGALGGPATTNQTTGTASNVVAGWVAGGGLEWMVAAHWSIRGEYLFTQFAHDSFTTPSNNANCGGPNACSFTLNPRTTVQMARFGANYKF